MKRILLLIAVLMLALPASSQVISKAAPKLRIGVKAGVHYQSNDFVGQEIAIYDIKPGTGVLAGVQADLKWNRFGVHPELLYSYIAMESEVPKAIYKSDVKVSKIDLPILFEYEVLGFLNLQAGPTFALYTATGGECSVWVDAKNALTAKWDFKRPPVGIVAGGDARIWKFNFAVRYYKYFGKGEFTGIASGKSSMHGVQASLGYYF
jgi:hypothetical protein